MNVKIISMLAALAVAVPVVAEAAPAGGLTAQPMSGATTSQALDSTSVAPGESTAKVEKVWWRRGGWRGGWGGRRFGWRGGWGYRRFGYGYGWRRPFFGYYRPFGWRRYYW